jgi:hypothetical protein
MKGKKLLLIVNPFGGTSQGMKTYQTLVLPILKLAGLEDLHELIGKERVDHQL